VSDHMCEHPQCQFCGTTQNELRALKAENERLKAERDGWQRATEILEDNERRNRASLDKLDAILDKSEQLNQECITLTGAVGDLAAERDTARADAEWMRPVFEAAVEWHGWYGTDDKETVGEFAESLWGVIDTALTAKGNRDA